MIFGRANEEIEGLRAAGVPVTVVPGVTAALGSRRPRWGPRSQSAVPRRRLQFVTAHAKDGRLPQDIDWRALADPGASTVVYMGVRTMPALVTKLREHGLPGDTPCVLVERATCPDERRLWGTVATMPGLTHAADPKGPCLMMIGVVFSEPSAAASAAQGAEAPVSYRKFGSPAK